MHEVTTELIREITTRLYSQIPGLPPAPSPRSAAGTQGVSVEMPGAITDIPVEQLPFALTPPTSVDGLRAFVQRVQAPHQNLESGLCSGQPGARPLTGLFSGNSIPAHASRPLDVPSIRRDFPILNERVHGKPLVWLDNAATTQKPQSVIDALSH